MLILFLIISKMIGPNLIVENHFTPWMFFPLLGTQIEICGHTGLLEWVLIRVNQKKMKNS